MTDGESGGFGTVVPAPLTTLDPTPWYAEMRESTPVWHDESTGLWFLFRYDDVERAFADHETFAASEWSAFDANDTLPAPTMMDADPPTHGRLRKPVEAPFVPGTVAERSEEIRAVVDEQLATVAGEGQLDFAEDVARPVTLRVILSMLGVPEGRWDRLRALQAETEHFHGEDEPPTASALRRARAATEEMLDVFGEVLDDPRPDSLLSLVAAAADLSRDEKLSLCMLPFRGGNNNTTTALTNVLWVLAEEHRLEDLLAGHLDHDRVFDETLRYRAPLQFMAPRATTERVTLSGTTIPAGEPVGLMIESANRDPRQFADPDEFDPERPARNHLAFGAGNHLCLGWALARLEGRILLDAIAEGATGVSVGLSDLQARPGPNSTPATLPTRIEMA